MKRKMEESEIDFDEVNLTEEVKFIDKAEEKTEFPKMDSKPSVKKEKKEDVIESCLRKEVITVRHINKPTGLVTNPKHVLYGGMAETAVRYFTVPLLEKSGTLKNVLTDKEKAYLEEVMGLEYNALSIYKKGTDNFWTNYQVRLTKSDTYLDLSIPDDYIKYKVLLANTDYIAPSINALQDTPKATYQFVILEEGAETRAANDNVTTTQSCWKEFGKYEDNADILRMVIETVTGRPLSANTKIDSLRTRASDLITSDAKLFLKTITDPLIKTKVLLRKAVETGIVSRRGDYYYLTDGDLPLCNSGEDPTLTSAARFLNLPKNQDMKFSIEAKLKR